MILTVVMAFSAAASPIPPAAAKRCGWIDNPTPGNWWLRDREGEWTLSEQGGYEAPGMDALPDMSTKGWVETNGPHGYGCGCLTVAVDRNTRQVTRVVSGGPVPLRQCRVDRRLPKM